jgi:hypothetical protein
MGLLPNNLRVVFDPVPALFPAGTDIIAKSIEMFYGLMPFPDTINLRKLNNGAAGTLNQGRYGLDKMLKRRGDAREERSRSEHRLDDLTTTGTPPSI